MKLRASVGSLSYVINENKSHLVDDENGDNKTEKVSVTFSFQMKTK